MDDWPITLAEALYSGYLRYHSMMRSATLWRELMVNG